MTENMHEARRQRVYEQLGNEAALIVAASPEVFVGLDAELRYVVDPDLFYLTGYVEPEAVLVLCPAFEESRYTLFVRPRDAERELWTGVRGGPEAAKERFGADAAHPIAELGERLPKIVGSVDRLYARLRSDRPDVDTAVLDVIARARRSRPRSGKGPLTVADRALVLNEMRLRKDAREIAALREAARITAETFLEAAARVRPGAGEWEIEAALEGGFRSRGASGPAFPTIVAAGANATVLHYIENGCNVQDGQLVLVDAGARKAMYCADISRTFPARGRFTDEQRALYDGVLHAHDAAIAAVRPGATVRDVHDAALRVLVDALVALGFLDGPVDALLEKEESYKAFFPHKTTHWLGLDVHDVGDYMVAGASRKLEPGMVLTVEPGLYIATGATSGPPALAGTGIRIEDDVLVTPHGHEVLTAAIPADAETVATLTGAAR
jgi:Xaa-Pro aminopeptidase